MTANPRSLLPPAMAQLKGNQGPLARWMYAVSAQISSLTNNVAAGGNHAVLVRSGGQLTYANIPDLVGAVASFLVGGVSRDGSDLPYVNPANLAMMVERV